MKATWAKMIQRHEELQKDPLLYLIDSKVSIENILVYNEDTKECISSAFKNLILASIANGISMSEIENLIEKE